MFVGTSTERIRCCDLTTDCCATPFATNQNTTDPRGSFGPTSYSFNGNRPSNDPVIEQIVRRKSSSVQPGSGSENARTIEEPIWEQKNKQAPPLPDPVPNSVPKSVPNRLPDSVPDSVSDRPVPATCSFSVQMNSFVIHRN